MALRKVTYVSEETVISAENLNDIQDAIQELEDGLFAIDNDSSGEVITITDAAKRGFRSLNLYGKTTQNGTPTPEAPVELVSVGNGGSITVNVTGEDKAQSVTIATPNGLPGIPVTSGGNYTDANGQQWICDEIDFAMGVYMQRAVRFSFAVADMNSSESYPGWKNSGIAKYYPNASNAIGRYGAAAMCNIDSNPSETVHINTTSTGDVMMIPNPNGLTQSEWKAQYPNLVFELIVSIPTPIETPLSEEELAAYSRLHTYKDHTTVSNDAGAWMDLEYVMDAKKYLARLAANGGLVVGSTVRVAEIDLLAAKWTGTESPYSQAVRITGVTSYSQVDLKPSVEQMAIFHEKDLAFVTENDEGVVTVYAIGQKPTNDYTMQVSITEVTV